jgi:serine/threonine-protein kinase
MCVTPGTSGGLVGKKLGDYELRELLGVGGMAEVYRGHDVALGREVAVKVLPAALALDPGYVDRFRDEARRVAGLTHPNVVPVYHYGEEEGLLFLVMPILKESLRDRMEREGALPPSDAAKLVVQVAAALDAAHAQGIVHRDVKPENILLNHEGKGHLTDFGIARELSFLKETGPNRTLAATGLPVGTPEYMAPEQLRAGDVDQRADIYALGAVLYELLTGSVPHEAPTAYEVAALVLTAPTMPPSQRNPQIWPELEAVVLTALAKEAKDRFRDARSFAMALRRSVLQRDPNAPKLTMPAGAFTAAPGMAGTSGALVVQGPSGPQVLNPAPAAGAVAVLPPLTGPLMAMPTGAPVPWFPEPIGTRPRGVRPRPLGRKSALVAALLVLAIVGVCGGSSLALLKGLALPGAPIDLRFPIGNGLTGAGTETPDTGGNTGGTGTSTGTVTSGSPDATATPTRELTATPVPQSLSVGNVGLSFKHDVCTGTQTITNQSAAATIGWLWTSNPYGSDGQYKVNGSSASSPPRDVSPGIGPASSDTVSITVDNCMDHLGPKTITLRDTTDSQYSYTFTVSIDSGGAG